MVHHHDDDGRQWINALLAGLAGAATVTLLNESVRRVRADAPRMDVLGRVALGKSMDAAGIDRPGPRRMQQLALAGDIVSNTMYYSMVGCPALGGSAMTRGMALGAAAGIGAIALPGVLGLPQWPTRRSGSTAVMAFGWYFAAGLAAGAAMTALESMACCQGEFDIDQDFDEEFEGARTALA